MTDESLVVNDTRL